jgi:hypothetical protein
MRISVKGMEGCDAARGTEDVGGQDVHGEVGQRSPGRTVHFVLQLMQVGQLSVLSAV